METINREFVRRLVRAGVTTLEITDEVVDGAIDDACLALANLIHYRSGKGHFDEDVSYMARVLIQRVINAGLSLRGIAHPSPPPAGLEISCPHCGETITEDDLAG